LDFKKVGFSLDTDTEMSTANVNATAPKDTRVDKLRLNQGDGFKKFCAQCKKGERLSSSSNAKLDFDYCTVCKGKGFDKGEKGWGWCFSFFQKRFASLHMVHRKSEWMEGGRVGDTIV
jgi:hypothetical protein